MKTLYILRHAKAAGADPSADDHARPLTDRGVADAYRVGEYMRAAGLVPELALCSSSVRTRQTLQQVEAALGQGLNAQVIGKLYLASPRDVLEQLALVEEGVRSVLIVGHNPTLQQLSVDIAGGSGDLALQEAMARSFPTASFVELQCNVRDWVEVGAGGGVLKRFVVPAGVAA